jgi:hypothetical protein
MGKRSPTLSTALPRKHETEERGEEPPVEDEAEDTSPATPPSPFRPLWSEVQVKDVAKEMNQWLRDKEISE